MGDQKDHVTIQKKDVEPASQQVETQDFEAATESISPPSLQLKAEETSDKEGIDKETAETGAFQFSLAGPPEKPSESASRQFSGETTQGKGIAEPFKIPTIQKKAAEPNAAREAQKASFKL